MDAQSAPPASQDGGHGKRTRFSLSHDAESVGTSDNLEVEVSSTHSMPSSVEEEEDLLIAERQMDDAEISLLQDNLSDAVPTPSVSGRDTPSSFVHQDTTGACI